ncbi:hypothetical protein B0T18DRAFT_128275 [Schizothecium vesticola]|uniref:Uncharacterized protein n=1 Tax=Schizothecium vesticola TaxID=314040 RepID=A0AA40K9J6_9PEZI|nr:hypothetical protein B0T18DRAFT_128275 [Schizothecium vesticola]
MNLQPTGKWGTASLYHAKNLEAPSSFNSNPQRDCQTPAGLEHGLAAATAGDETKDGRHQSQTLSRPLQPGGWGRSCLCNLSRVWCFPNVCLGSHQRLVSSVSSGAKGPLLSLVSATVPAMAKLATKCLPGPACQWLVRPPPIIKKKKNRPADGIVGLPLSDAPSSHRRPRGRSWSANTLPPAPPQGITDQTPGTGETSPFSPSLGLDIRFRLSIAGRLDSAGRAKGRLPLTKPIATVQCCSPCSLLNKKKEKGGCACIHLSGIRPGRLANSRVPAHLQASTFLTNQNNPYPRRGGAITRRSFPPHPPDTTPEAGSLIARCPPTHQRSPPVIEALPRQSHT